MAEPKLKIQRTPQALPAKQGREVHKAADAPLSTVLGMGWSTFTKIHLTLPHRANEP